MEVSDSVELIFNCLASNEVGNFRICSDTDLESIQNSSDLNRIFNSNQSEFGLKRYVSDIFTLDIKIIIPFLIQM